ncbi:MAG: hypothetical protein A3H97_05420 [Acidobacteria bacterium RIFCSPLOWO2_02_FULL_65_29]|nr:MAG: hypothetical protein A3H97_05420 [Acidobacteria bacterium RIFCSPLOWO2_02_FULL_65_29]
MARFPAIDVDSADGDLVLAVVDDYSPTAVEERDDHDGALTIFFSDPAARDSALEAIRRAMPAARITAREVDDEDWARRSQEALGPVTVGRVVVAPPWAGQLFSTGAGAPPPARSDDDASPPGSAWPQALPVSVIIRPSMAFGTGHHATTRLCLAAVQLLNLTGTFVLDIGTGSGVLAIAARLLGAEGALGIDNDPDAVQCARENLALNPGVDHVRFTLGDLTSPRSFDNAGLWVARGLEPLRPADVVIANLTGALLCRTALALANAFAPGGALIVSGLLAEERDAVVAAFQRLDLVWEMEEEGWVGLGFARL